MSKKPPRQDIELLKRLDRDAHLAKLEEMLDQFNIFEALGVVRHELRHSEFLAFLLRPQASHGLGDAFAKSLVRLCFTKAQRLDPASKPKYLHMKDYEQLEFSQASVLREWANIDILFLDKQNKLVMIIENKIDTIEHSDQLREYLQIIESHPTYKSWIVIPLYLTPHGALPTDARYLAVGYAEICDILDGLLREPSLALSTEVQLTLQAYTRMVRRYIVGNSEIERLAREIYIRHKRALDLLYRDRPDYRQIVNERLTKCITAQKDPGLVLDDLDQTYIRFAVKNWDDAPRLKTGTNWTTSHRVLLFVATNSIESLTMELFIGSGDESVRQHLKEDVARKHPHLFNAPRIVPPAWIRLYSKPLLTADDYATDDVGDLGTKLEGRWADFAGGDLQQIAHIIETASWLWEPMAEVDPHT